MGRVPAPGTPDLRAMNKTAVAGAPLEAASGIVRAAAADRLRLGPYSGGERADYRRRSGVWRGAYITSPHEASVFGLFKSCRVLSARQVELLGGRREALSRLVRKGYLDVYECSSSPPLYAPSAAGAEALGLKYKVYGVVELLRAAAANQAWAHMSRLWSDAVWECSPEVSVLTRGGDRLYVVAPRNCLGEDADAWQRMNALTGSRVLVVASCMAQAERLTGAHPEAVVRYTWDIALGKGFRVYRWTGGGFMLEFEWPQGAAGNRGGSL